APSNNKRIRLQNQQHKKQYSKQCNTYKRREETKLAIFSLTHAFNLSAPLSRSFFTRFFGPVLPSNRTVKFAPKHQITRTQIRVSNPYIVYRFNILSLEIAHEISQ